MSTRELGNSKRSKINSSSGFFLPNVPKSPHVTTCYTSVENVETEETTTKQDRKALEPGPVTTASRSSTEHNWTKSFVRKRKNKTCDDIGMILWGYCDDIVMIVMSDIVKHMSKSCEVERVTNLALSRASSARLCSSVWFVRCVRVYASSVNQPPLHSNIPASTILHHVLQILRSFYCPHCRMPLEETQTCHRVPSRSWKGSKGSKENRQNRLLTSLDMWP